MEALLSSGAPCLIWGAPPWRSPNIDAIWSDALLRRDFPADGIFLLVEHLLLRFRDVAAILAGHVALLLPDLMILTMNRGGLTAGQGPLFDVLVDPLVLIGEAVVDLFATRVILLPRRIRARGPGGADQRRGDDGCAQKPGSEAVHLTIPRC